MELSDSDRAAITTAVGMVPPLANITVGFEAVYLAGKSAGIAEGLEMAAKACENLPPVVVETMTGTASWPAGSTECAAAVRALKSSP